MSEAPTDVTRESPPPAAATGTGWLAAAGFCLGVASFALWAFFGLPAPLVATLALVLGHVAARRSSGRPGRMARWALRLGGVHLFAWAAFLALLAAFGTLAFSSVGV